MPKQTQRERDLATWNSLNDRQRHYLKAVYVIDQENEDYEKSKSQRDRLNDQRPATEFPGGWRWINYHPIHERGTTRLQDEITPDNIDPGTGSTFEALERRQLIECNYRTFADYIVLHVMITALGRRVVRAADPDYKPGATSKPAGWLQEWHWKLLAEMYADFLGQTERPTSVTYRWGTFLRLRDFKPEALGVEWSNRKMNVSAAGYPHHDGESGVRITGAGRVYYERHHAVYRTAYPNVPAEQPRGDAPPAADPDDPKTLREIKAFQEAIRTFLCAKYPQTDITGKPSYDYRSAARAYCEMRGVKQTHEVQYIWRYFPNVPETRDQFFALCQFAELQPQTFPRLIDRYPEPGSERATFGVAVDAWLEVHPDSKDVRTSNDEIAGIGSWSRHRFKTGFPMQHATFLYICRYMSFDPAVYPTLHGGA